MKPIWIVDDDQSIRFVLEKALLREDLPTRSFTNTREVLAALELAADDEQQGPQVLVSDIRMPGGSGLDLLDKIKAKHPGLPVIIMTRSPTSTAPSRPSRAAPSNTCPSPSTCHARSS